MFNPMFSNNELNAVSKQEAFEQIMRYAAMLNTNAPSNASIVSAPSYSDSDRDDLITRAILTSDGKIALAQAMANPIRRNLDYIGIARRTVALDPLPQGATAQYDRDIDVAAVIVSQQGGAPESRVFADRITIPEFEVICNPTVRIHEVRRRRFNVIDRAIQKARQELMAQEDANIFSALDVAAQVENMLTDISDNGLTKRDLSEIKCSIDRWDLVTAKFFLNINEFNDILNWGSGGGQGSNGGEIDPVTQREILQTGLYARIWGADILVSKIVPVGTVYGCADPDFVGIMPIRQDVEVLPADVPQQLKLGWVVNEIIGLGIVNPRAVAGGRKSLAVG